MSTLVSDQRICIMIGLWKQSCVSSACIKNDTMIESGLFPPRVSVLPSIKGKIHDTDTHSVDGGLSPIITLYHRHVCCTAAEPPSLFPLHPTLPIAMCPPNKVNRYSNSVGDIRVKFLYCPLTDRNLKSRNKLETSWLPLLTKTLFIQHLRDLLDLFFNV
jgi:hypothetical protein